MNSILSWFMAMFNETCRHQVHLQNGTQIFLCINCTSTCIYTCKIVLSTNFSSSRVATTQSCVWSLFYLSFVLMHRHLPYIYPMQTFMFRSINTLMMCKRPMWRALALIKLFWWRCRMIVAGRIKQYCN